MFTGRDRYNSLIVVAIVLLLLTLLPGQARSLGHEGDQAVLRAVGRGNPWVSLLEGTDLPAVYTGAAASTRAFP